LDNFPVQTAGILVSGTTVAQALYPSFSSIDCADANPRALRSQGSAQTGSVQSGMQALDEQHDYTNLDGKYMYFIKA
jgi:hypothetical protein